MGLGPPVCERCHVIGNLKGRKWYCPVCNNEDMKLNLFSCGMSQEYLDANEKFLRFVKGESITDTGR